MTSTKQTAQTKSGRTLIATAERVGLNFGWVGVVKARDGRKVHETQTRPFEEAAVRDAVDWIEAQA